MTRNAARLHVFQRRLLAWYKLHQRDLPWRKTRDPYKILVSEIMLQQTQVDRVMPKYRQFLSRYPDFQSLAAAKTAELKRVWYPLGYNIRPLRLRKIAQQTVTRYDGKLPDTHDGLLAMEGIGPYTAGAVLTFAFEQDAPMLDTNIARVLARYFGVRGDLRKGPAQKRLWKLAAQVIPPGNGYDINQAMMDLGATVCTARAPKCPSCAVRLSCKSFPYAKEVAQKSPRRSRRH